MNDFTGLTSQEMEHLIFSIETSLKVSKRFQFFLWVQGSLQGFLPHDRLICAHGDIRRGDYRCETFSRDAAVVAGDADIGDPVAGVMPRIVDEWLRTGCEPLLGGPSPGTAQRADGAGIGGRMAGHEIGNVVAHGAREIRGRFGSFFAFLHLPQPPSARESYLVEMFMPYLHMALHRMLANEGWDSRACRGDGADWWGAPEARLSAREVQVLEWVRDGKTNPEIARILSISPLTVKNHVQKILRKLKVTNRAQAAGKGAASPIFATATADRRRETDR